MIEQRINLYTERFHDKRLWVSAAQVGAMLLLLLVVGGIWSYWLHAQLEQSDLANQAIKADRDRLVTELGQVNAELASLLEDDRVEQQIASTARQISARKKVLNFVDSNRFGSGQGFSDYLVALSNLSVDDIWLSQIRLGQDFVQLKGSSLSAEQVPTYFDSFSGEAVFAGNRFDLFRVSRAEDTDWKVDFEIATREGGGE